MIKTFFIAIILLVLALLGLGIRLLLDRKAEFKGSSCQAAASSEELSSKGISCGCGEECEQEN